jgi:hypothetical protein
MGGIMKNIILFFLFFVIILNLSATIINIPEDYPTIQEGIIMSTEGDTVLVSPGIYYENIYYYMKNITVASLFLTTQDTTYISQTIIDGNQNGSVVTFVCSVEDSTSVLCGFTIQNGYNTDSGGGIYIEDSNSILTMPILENLIIKNNCANYGGGIFIDYSYTASPGPILTDLIIEDNYAYAGGGGIVIAGSTLSLERVTISNNNATGSGGGILCIAAFLELIQVKIQNNSMEGFCGTGCGSMYLNNVLISDNFGYGIYGEFDQLEVRDAIITNNLGGGLHLWNTDTILENVLITDNGSEEIDGGGIYVDGGVYRAEITIINSAITSNSSNLGGGLYIKDGDAVIINSTITSNISNSGGGIYSFCSSNDVSRTLLLNSILWNNEPQQVHLRQGYNATSFFSTYYSCIEGGMNGITSSSSWPIYWGEGNIESDPLFINPEEDDFHLQDTSPCIGAGVEEIEITNSQFFTAGTYYAPEYDIEGNPRPNPIGSMPDIGAYESPYGEPQTIINEELLSIIYYRLNNHPNPFNPSTTISFSIPNDSEIELNIYNIKGQKVKQLVSDQFSAGEHSVIWNGKDNNGKQVDSGVYFYRLQTPSESYVKKCMLLK